jgi:hypothetical protein
LTECRTIGFNFRLFSDLVTEFEFTVSYSYSIPERDSLVSEEEDVGVLSSLFLLRFYEG